MQNEPLVSIMIPYYNDRLFLRQSIDSVLNSTYQNFELILVNHATTDDCREIAHSYKDSRIKHIDLPYNCGYGGTGLLLKEFLKIAKGKYVKPLCADDMIKPDGLKILVNHMESHPEKDFVFGNVEYIDREGKSLNDNWFNARNHFNINDSEADSIRKLVELKCTLPYLGSIVKREILYNITINTTFIMMFDINLWLELLCHGYKIGFCDSVIANYRIHPNQTSALGNTEVASNACFFEFTAYWKTLIGIKDVTLAKEVWKDSKYAEYLTSEEDIPFFVAQALMEFKTRFYYAYAILSDLLCDDEQREHIEKTFNYTIKDLRKACMAEMERRKLIGKSRSFFKKFKEGIYSTPSKNLGLRALSFLFLHRIFNLITLKPIIKHIKDKKKKQKYSL